MQNYCRIAPSIGKLDGDPHKVWSTLPYTPDTNPEHLDAPCVFFGIYGLNDFYALWRHRGKKWVFWAGSDIRHFKDGYWLDDVGKIRIESKQLAKWMNDNCETWVENQVEAEALRQCGIHKVNVGQSFVGDVNEYPLDFTPSRNPRVYASVSGNDFELYRWKEIEQLAFENPEVEFHLYGNTVEYKPKRPLTNFVVHGRVPKEQMNAEIRTMQGALRPLPFDGFSEVLAKSVLLGQWPISKINYKYILKMKGLKFLKNMKHPNVEGRDYYIKNLNNFPWSQK